MRSRSGGWSSDSIQRALSRQRRTRPLTTMIVLIDNYDSFTYNLVQRLGELDPNIELQVFRNDKIDVDQVEKLQPSHIIISPGPCTPREAGVSNQIIERFASKIPILWVCLGQSTIVRVVL